MHISENKTDDVRNESLTRNLFSEWIHASDNDIGSAPRIFVVCDQSDTAQVWSYVLSQQRLIVIAETSLEKATDAWCVEMPELGVIDINCEGQDLIALCKKFRAVSVAPLLLFVPAYDEKQILEAYEAGIDEVVVKPVSPAMFLAKIVSWLRQRFRERLGEISSVGTHKYRLNIARRCLIDSHENEIKLTKLEFRLLTIVSSRIGQVFSDESLIREIWGRYRPEDQVLLTNIIYRLRKKIEANPSQPRHLQRWQGGYSFHP
ncbi:MAG TPA: response regulator transcription factor [Anaerolineales bacterium]|nr:response regulator transcription factor [Anaerolineales bacterium]